MNPISLDEIQKLRFAIQYFQDCYLVSSVGALTRSVNGRKILTENIAHTDNGFRVKFRNINGKNQDFFVSQKESDDLVYMDKYLNPIPINKNFPHNPIIKAIEVAMNKLISKDPSKKPWICRFPNCNEEFEFNKPSNFLEIFTGKSPLVLNEGGIRLTLKSKEKESLDIFEGISKTPENNSFVVGTTFGFRKGMSDNHCYSVLKVNPDDKSIDLFDHRCQECISLTFKEAMKRLKFIVGYFDKDLI